ncbi:hypothetical protein V2G26_012473 [Clonostachys chloroleuca]|uniref:Nitroreductase domain-containing protein n=1 Tax=Clonostachys chloroleuca TaxID=1926264 RepID=A0AA35M8N9_9HYPO|nr:unnamed protein product [Clonostachys chloroleuca]
MPAFTETTNTFLDAVKSRRTYYQLNKDLGFLTRDEIQELVTETTLHTPSSYNSQSNRLLVLFGAEHDKLWDIVRDTLEAIVAPNSWQHTADRIAGFRAAAGTILFFDDQDAIKKMQEQFPRYADNFPMFATQSLAMQQYILWATLETEGLGANLQHYSPLIDDKVAAEWDIPTSWKLNAQLVFGGRAGDPGPKQFQDVEERVRFFGPSI